MESFSALFGKLEIDNMSRLAKSPILLKGVEVKAAKGSVEVKGPKGTMKRVSEGISVDVRKDRSLSTMMKSRS